MYRTDRTKIGLLGNFPISGRGSIRAYLSLLFRRNPDSRVIHSGLDVNKFFLFAFRNVFLEQVVERETVVFRSVIRIITITNV